MVSLWPFKGQDTSPASFEKTLSTLSTKITQATSRLDSHRQHARRFKALWTLYTTFAYLLYSIILALVLGWQNWGLIEYAAIIGGPVLIFLVRAAASRFFDYRISKTQRTLDDLQKQRDETIEKLKVATKYNSTQQLLEKYAGESPAPQQLRKSGDDKRKGDDAKRTQPSTPQHPPVQRTGIAPPPTANIRRPTPAQSPQLPSPDQRYPSPPPQPQPQSQSQSQSQPPSPYPGFAPQGAGPNPGPAAPAFDEPGFAPNAFPSSPQYSEHSHWYDRLLDVLLGEDETQPKNRIALICRSCRLVNGQAPPGIKSLEELGRWRCGSCGAWNGEESETRKVLAGMGIQSEKKKPREESVAKSEDEGDDDRMDDDAGSEDESERTDESEAEPEPEPESKPEPEPEPVKGAKGKRGRGRPKKNNR